MQTVLDIGCGTRKIEPDAVGIDVSPHSAADHVWNLDCYPWPLEGDRFTRIHMSHVIEHLEDPCGRWPRCTGSRATAPTSIS